jgi:trigger factor
MADAGSVVLGYGLRPMRTETTLLEGDRAVLEVEVPAERVEHDLQHTLGHLAHSVRVPGFRKGRVPPAVVLQRLGREEVLDETLREHLDRWYADALNESRLKPIEQPDIDWKVLPDEGEPFRFTATMRLRPKGALPDPLVLEAARHDDTVPEELVERELETLRKEGSPLVSVDDRPAIGGDYVELDFHGRDAAGNDLPGAFAESYHVELGAGRILPQMEQAIIGMRPGEEQSIQVDFPPEYPSPGLAGTSATFDLKLRAIEQRELAPLDDELARKISEFDTLAELRADVERVIGERITREVDGLFRGAVAQQIGRAVIIDLPEALIEQRVNEMTMSLARAVGERGIPFRRYLELRGQTLEDVQSELRGDAVEGLRRELALEALADRDAITVSDELLEARLREDAAAEGIEDVETIVQEVLASPAKEDAREDLRFQLALDRAMELATPIAPELAEAREQLWTPEKEGDSGEAKPALWTPGDPR